MRMLILLGALCLASSVARAGTADLAKVGVSDVDTLFREVSSATAVLHAAEARMDALMSEVAGPLGLPSDSTLARSVWTIGKQAGGDVRSLTADGRPVLMVGSGAPTAAREAAGALNEGTQELAVMAADIGRMPERLSEVADRAETLSIDAAARAAGLDVAGAKASVKSNVATTRAQASRAKIVAARAKAMIDQVQAGLAAKDEPDVPAVAPAPAPAPAAAPAAAKKELPSVGDVVARAWAQFNDAELDAAVELLAEADLLLPRQTKPVPRADLIQLFQVRGLVNLVQGDATAATWSVTQALVIHPNATPDSRLGPDYARLHKAIAKAGVVRKVDVAVKGEGRAYLSGIEVTGGSTVQLGQGQHLLQVEKGDTWVSSVVYVRDGFVVAF